MYNFYIPITSIKIDTNRLLQEMLSFIKRHYLNEFARGMIQHSYSFTTTAEHVNDPEYNFRKFTGITYGDVENRKTIDGVLDRDIVHWPDILQDSYMKEIGDQLSKLVGIPEYRVRGSIMKPYVDFLYNKHIDYHTPYRIHIALLTDPENFWFLDDVKIHQPADGVPVIIDTGKVAHSFCVPKDKLRIHFWYQFYQPIKQEILEQLMSH